MFKYFLAFIRNQIVWLIGIAGFGTIWFTILQYKKNFDQGLGYSLSTEEWGCRRCHKPRYCSVSVNRFINYNSNATKRTSITS